MSRVELGIKNLELFKNKIKIWAWDEFKFINKLDYMFKFDSISR